MAAAARPLVSVHALEGDMATDGAGGAAAALPLPDVLRTPIRPDVVRFVHDSLSGTGASRTPCPGARAPDLGGVVGHGARRVPHPAHLATLAPPRQHPPPPRRRRLRPRRLRRPSLVLARGHRVDSVPELPLVVSDSAESIEKTSAAIKALSQIGALPDADKAKDSLSIRPGKGKMRNRRYISRKGPLIIYGTEGSKIVKAFRNIPGVDVANVERLNLLKLAPGGHLGRFIIWTRSAFEKLDSVFGTFDKPSEKKKGFVLPRPKMANPDLSRIINSDEVQSVVRPINREVKRRSLKKNPLKNINTLLRLNPYAKTARRMALLAEAQRVKAKKEKLDKKRSPLGKEEAAKIKAAGKAWYKTMISDSDYTEFENFSKWLGVSQ
uniref:Large ribosomal subunit protein uL4 C-terminal domain-containing protein n=1 Tax=Ananas comosus var. bracteatus TaxID=296719 RepID=A0A6V7NMK9_ANACO|nr:unnamed protein product [Ananas comosus var. bracteatus]